MPEWLHVAIQLALGLLGLSILVFVHELGHFLAAKYFRVKVEVFSIGFGKKLLWWKRGDTTYCISAIPFGGYVAMAGEDPKDEEKTDVEGSFAKQSILARAIIAFAGPAVNIVFAILTLMILYMVGVQEAVRDQLAIGYANPTEPAYQVGIREGDTILHINGKPAQGWESYREEVATSIGVPVKLEVKRKDGSILQTQFIPVEDEELGIGRDGLYPPLRLMIMKPPVDGSPAAIAGLASEDIILTLNGHRLDSIDQFTRHIADGQGESIHLQILRDQDTLNISATPQWDAKSQRFLIGVQIGVATLVDSKLIQRGPVEAFTKACVTSWNLATSIFRYISRMMEDRVSSKSLSSVPGIVAIIGNSWLESFHQLLMILALISVNLGVMNLLPLAITDGGVLMFLGLEAIRGKPLSQKVQARIQQIAMAVFVALFIYLSIQDFSRFGLFLR